jgi:hypothetical protein
LLILFSSGSHGFAGHPSSIECTPYKFRSKAIRKEIFCVNKKLTASPKTKLKLRDVSFQIHSGKWKKKIDQLPETRSVQWTHLQI